MNDGENAVAGQHALSLLQKQPGFSGMEDIEQHHEVGTAIRKSAPLFDKIPPSDDQVFQARRGGCLLRRFHHLDVDVERVHESVDKCGCWSCERPEAAAEIHDALVITFQAQALQNEVRVEEGSPEVF
nr:hypothetical protein [Caulifigura coniformis]